MSVPPVSSCSSQVPVDESASIPAPEALTSDTAASASISTPVLSASYFGRVSEQITASEALLVLQEGPRVSQSYLLIETIPETQDVTQTSDFSLVRRTPTLDHTDAMVDPAAATLPLHFTPMDEASGVQVSLRTQYVSPVFGNLPYPAGQTLPTQAAASLLFILIFKFILLFLKTKYNSIYTIIDF